MHWAFNPKSDIARIYLSRKDRCGGPIGVEDTVKLSIVWLDRYVLTSEEGLPISARGLDGDYEQNVGTIESVNEFKEVEEMSEVMC